MTLFLLKKKYYSLQDLLFVLFIMKSMIKAKQKALTHKRKKQFKSFDHQTTQKNPHTVGKNKFTSQILHLTNSEAR